MKAVVYTTYGPPEVLRLEEMAIPEPKDNEVLVKVHATSINSWDWDLLTGRPRVYRMLSGLTRPRYPVIGSDIAGVVEKVGSKVTTFSQGDAVFGDLSPAGFGAFAEFVSTPEKWLARKPESLSFAQAASLPQAGVLALQGLRQGGDLMPGQKVLINGAGGGVGTFALQLARRAGVEVTCVDAGGKLDMLRRLGADHVIDYTKEDYTRSGKSYDKVVDVVANRSVREYKRILNPGGVFAIVGGAPDLFLRAILLGPWTAVTTGKKIGLMPHKPNQQDLEQLAEMVAASELQPVIDKTFPLNETAEAMRYFGKGSFCGKIVLNVRDQ